MNVKALAAPARPAAKSLFLLRELVRRDIRARYAGSIFGLAWAIATPLLWVLLYSFVFSVVLRIPLSGEPAGVNFPEFLLAAFLPWLAIQEGISRGATCLTDNAAMVKKTVFPRETLVATVVLSALAAELIGLALFCGYLAMRGHLSAPWLLLLIPALFFQTVLTYGLASFLACTTVFFRDVMQFVGLGLAMLAFLTPIFYPAAAVPPRFRILLAVNPFAHLVEIFRDALFRHVFPSAGSILYFSSFSLAAALLGSLFFARAQPHVADLL